mgnify:CR=1 FL=1
MRFFFQAEGGIRDLVRSRGLGDVYKRQGMFPAAAQISGTACRRKRRNRDRRVSAPRNPGKTEPHGPENPGRAWCCLLYTSDAADERSSVDLGGRRNIKKKKQRKKKNVYGYKMRLASAATHSIRRVR